jgi:ferredoxin
MKAVVLNTDDESVESLYEAARECPTQAIYLWRGRTNLYP